MARWVEVGLPKEIADQECKIIEIDNVAIAIFNLAGEFFAFEDNCPHQNLPLADGMVEGDDITCPYHGAKFCIKTGEVLGPPACQGLKMFAARVVDNKIEIEI